MRIPLILAAAFLLTGVSAEDVVCDERSWPEVTLCYRGDQLIPDCSEDADRFVYVDNDPCQLQACGLSLWIYEESNGYEGLQRKDTPTGDDRYAPWLKDDTCGGLIQPDTILF